jgi:ATP-dependent Lon protease
MQLAAAQFRLAHDYGYRNWAELMTAVQSMASGSGAGTGNNPSQPSGSPLVSERGANVFPFLPLRWLVAFPHVSYPIFVGRPTSIRAVQYAKEQKVPIVLAAQKDPDISDPSICDPYEVGTLATVIEAILLPDGTIKCVAEGKARARVSRFIFDDDFSKAEAAEIEEPVISDAGLQNLVTLVVAAFVRRRLNTFVEALNKPEAQPVVAATTTYGASVLADRIASEVQMHLAWKQALLELLNPADRLEKILAFLNAPS